MTITRQQKNIINPYVLEDIEYNFTTDKRNLFVISAIHEHYLISHNFLPEGKVLKLSVQELSALGIDKDTPNIKITGNDLKAYSFLYSQNCNARENDAKISLERINDDTAKEKLNLLVAKLKEKGHLELYSTNSSPTAILPENINNTSLETAYTKLIAILPFHSSEYKKMIYKSIGTDQDPTLDLYQSIEQLSLSMVASAYVNNDENVDIYDWRANCEPGTETNKIYYNSVDDKFYYTERTQIAESQVFDQGYWSQQGRENASREMIKAIRKGVSEILKYTGRFSDSNVDSVLSLGVGDSTDDTKINFLSHLDVRPGSRWVYAVRIPRELVESISENDDIFISYDEFEMTPLERAGVLLDQNKNKTSNKRAIEAGNLVVHLPRVTKTLSTYAEQLQEEDITPEDLLGIDLSREIRTLDGFMDDLSLACLYNKVRLSDDDIIEFAFTDEYKLEYFTYNGYLMTRGTGNKDFHPRDEEDEVPNKAQKVLNTFSDSTPTTFSAVYNSERIYNDYSIVDEDNLKPWPEFFRDYLQPSVEISAEKIRRKSANSKANARRRRRKNIFTKVSELAREGKDIEDFYRRINTSRNPYYQIGRAVTSIDCDTGQAALLKDVMKIWSLFDSRISMRGKIRQAILLLRDEVIKDSATRAYLTQALQAEENPQLFIRDIEKQVNEQIFCSLDVLGNVIETSFLDPKDMNPTVKAEGATDAAKAPSPLKVELKVPKGWKGVQKSLFSKDSDFYEELVIKIVTAYLKSVAVGIGKDVIKAALGCGPDDNRSDVLDDALRDLKYGLLDLNQYVDDLNLIEIAKSVDLVNVSRENVDGTEQVTKTDPTDRQLTALITDVSYMCTPRELDQLIFGSAQNVLYELILETVNDGIITFPIDSDIDANGDDDIVTRTIDPTVYGSFEFTKEKIKDFFIALGDALRDEDIEDIAQLNISPLDAYCSNLDPDLGLERLGFKISPEQLEAQYISIAEDKINKINALCDWLKDLDNILRGLEDLLNDLPIMKQYEQMLEYITFVSNMLWNCLTEWWSNLWDEEIENDRTDVINLYSSRFGKDLFYAIRGLISKRIMMARVYSTGQLGAPIFTYVAPSPREYLEGSKVSSIPLPYPPPLIIDDNTSWWPLGSYDDLEAREKDSESSYALRTAPKILRDNLGETFRSDRVEGGEFAWDNIYAVLYNYIDKSLLDTEPDQWISNGPTEDASAIMTIENINAERPGVQITRRVKTGLRSSQFEVIASYLPEPGDFEPDSEGVDYYRLMSNIGPSDLGGPIVQGPRRQIIMPSRNNEDIRDIIDQSMFGINSDPGVGGVDIGIPAISVSNYTKFIDQTINFSFYNDEGKARMKTWLRGTNKPLYVPNDENCVTNKEVSIANSMILSIQARLQRFFMNTVSLASSYPHWNSLGTKKLVTDYLTRKVYDDLESKGLSNVFFEYAYVINRVYVDNPDNNISPLNENSPRDFIQSLVEQVYSSMLVNVSENVYLATKTSPYSNSTTHDRYKELVTAFYIQLLLRLNAAIAAQNYEVFGISGEVSVIRARDFIRDELFDDNSELTPEAYYYGAYYYPIGFLIAQYLITTDSIVNITRNFNDGHYRSLVEIANADDGILSAISENETSKFSSDYVGFPFGVVTGNGVYKILFSVSQSKKRLQDLGVILGRDEDTFNDHLQFYLEKREIEDVNYRADIPGILDRYNTADRQLNDAMRNDDDLGERAARRELGKIRAELLPITTNIYPNQIIIDFISGVLDGSLPSIEQSFPSILSWISLNLDSVGFLRDSYQQFFENYIVPETTIIPEIAATDGYESIVARRTHSANSLQENFGITDFSTLNGVILGFIEQVERSRTEDNYEEFEKEEMEIKMMLGERRR